jgi:MarR family transcriptional regulator, organic hydroperoxide resistance regulator
MPARVRPETTRERPRTVKAVRTNSDLPPATIGRPEILVDGSDRMFRSLIHGLLTFFALHEAIRDSYAAHVGLGGVQYTILQSIRHLGSRVEVNVRDVADHLRLSGSFVTVETNKLEALGLVHKEPAREDRRRVALRVTKKGAALLNDLAPMQRTVNDVQFANINRQEFLLLCRLVEQLIGSSQAALTLLHYLKGSDGGRTSHLKAPEGAPRPTPVRRRPRAK